MMERIVFLGQRLSSGKLVLNFLNRFFQFFHYIEVWVTRIVSRCSYFFFLLISLESFFKLIAFLYLGKCTAPPFRYISHLFAFFKCLLMLQLLLFIFLIWIFRSLQFLQHAFIAYSSSTALILYMLSCIMRRFFLLLLLFILMLIRMMFISSFIITFISLFVFVSLV